MLSFVMEIGVGVAQPDVNNRSTSARTPGVFLFICGYGWPFVRLALYWTKLQRMNRAVKNSFAPVE